MYLFKVCSSEKYFFDIGKFIVDFDTLCLHEIFMMLLSSQPSDNNLLVVNYVNKCFELRHYENLPMQYTVIFKIVKNENFQYNFFLYFSYFYSKHSSHNLCFGAKIRKIGIPLHTPVLLYKSGV